MSTTLINQNIKIRVYKKDAIIDEKYRREGKEGLILITIKKKVAE